jgi:GEVED domain/Secretion system C-terminal sorting domain
MIRCIKLLAIATTLCAFNLPLMAQKTVQSSVIERSLGQQSKPLVLFSHETIKRDFPKQAVLADAEKRSRIARLQVLDTEGGLKMTQEVVFNLFDDVQYTAQLKRKEGAFYEGVEIWTGRVADARFDHLSHYINTIVAIDRKKNEMVTTIETEKGFYQILPTDEHGLYRIRDCEPDPMNCDLIKSHEENRPSNALNLRNSCGSQCYNETDATGKYVIDILIGYSASAAASAGNTLAHAANAVELVNTGLTNSLVATTYLRIVGVRETPNNMGIIGRVMDSTIAWFPNDIIDLAPDMVAVYQTPTGAAGETDGWGYIPGFESVNNVARPTVLRHEIGHNVGGGHCNTDALFSVSLYAHGYNNRNWKTHMCGNTVNFYSTPLVNDNLGNPIGQVDSSDMARAWRDRAATMAQKRAHRIVYAADDACANVYCLPKHIQGNYHYIKKVTFNTINNDQATANSTCATTPNYSDFSNMTTDVRRGMGYNLNILPNYWKTNTYMTVWIDWDQDKRFEETEQAAIFTASNPWETPWLQNIPIPANALLGQTRMRIRLLDNRDNNKSSPCEIPNYYGGETEDYTLNVLAAPVLPIVLSRFEGKNTEGVNQLTWKTESEVNAAYFEVERSVNGQNFDKMTTVKAFGKANTYLLDDKNTTQKSLYYRLKMVDNDGTFAYSKIISLHGDKRNNNLLSIYPNPVTQFLTVETTEEAERQVVNLLGQTVLRSKAAQQIDVSALPSGTYFLKIGGQQARFVKQ